MKTPALLIGTIFCLVSIAQTPNSSIAASAKNTNVNQFNGTWKSKFGSFKILLLNKQKLQLEFSGTYQYKLADGSLSANTGFGEGTALIVGNKASFQPTGADSECQIALKFNGKNLEVKQVSNCGFGLNVTAAGKYQRINSDRPTFGL
jgi:hypothetical protein